MGKKDKVKKFSTKKLEEAFAIDEIIWLHNQKEHNLPSMNDYYDLLMRTQKTQFLLSSNESIKKVLDYELIGAIQINKNLKEKTTGYSKSNFYLFIITDYKTLHVSISITPFDFWYTFTSLKELKEFLSNAKDVFNPEEYIETFKTDTRGFIGTEKMLNLNILEVERTLILNKFTEILTWGSFWKDYPFRDYIYENDLSTSDRNALSIQAMKQEEYHYEVSIRTLFSKSIINIENYDGAYIINIYYNPLLKSENTIKKINDKYDRQYPLDLPMDVILSLHTFLYQDHISILEINDVTHSNLIIAQLLANTLDRQKELIEKLESLINEENKKDDQNKDYIKLIDDIIKETTVNKYLNMLLKNPDFKQFMEDIEVADDQSNEKEIKSQIKDKIEDELSEGKIEDLIKKEVYDDTINILYGQKSEI